MSSFVPSSEMRQAALKSLLYLFGMNNVSYEKAQRLERACAINCKDLNDYKSRITTACLSECLVKAMQETGVHNERLESIKWSDEPFSDLYRISALLTLQKTRKRKADDLEETSDQKRHKQLSTKA